MGKKFLVDVINLGWDSKHEVIWFDEKEDDIHSEEEAMAQFEPVERSAEYRNGYPYTAYNHDGKDYYKVSYRQTVEDGEPFPEDIIIDEDHREYHKR